MRLFTPPRTIALFAVIGLAAGVPAAVGFARSRQPPPAEVAPPAPLPPPAPVGLPDRMVQDAAAYDTFMRRDVAISPVFTDAQSVSRTLQTARAYAPKSLVRGAVAYAAIAALQDPTFVAAVREAGTSPENRTTMVGYILTNPAYVYMFKDSDVAAGLARGAIAPAALRLYTTGRAVHQAAYDIQKQGWSKLEVADLNGRLAAAEAAANGEMSSDPDELAQEKQSAAGATALPTAAAPLAPPYTLLVNHALQLAAIAALGEAQDGAYDQLSMLTVDDDTASCLGAAKRNFHQCLAVAKPNYEDIFCIGQHALEDTGACMAKAAGVALPPEPAAPPRATTRPAPRRTH